MIHVNPEIRKWNLQNNSYVRSSDFDAIYGADPLQLQRATLHPLRETLPSMNESGIFR